MFNSIAIINCGGDNIVITVMNQMKVKGFSANVRTEVKFNNNNKIIVLTPVWGNKYYTISSINMKKK